MNLSKDHWEKVYNKNEVNKLGWFEENPGPSLSLIDECGLSRNAVLLHVGAGASTLVDELLEIGYHNIIANDISSSALEKLKTRLGHKERGKVKWVVDDITKPDQLKAVGPVDLWHDRAVLHFFNSPEEQASYFKLLKDLVKINGDVIIAAFSLTGATRCSGLPVFRYDVHMIQEKLGAGFDLVKSFDYTYTMPSGDTRDYIYSLFKRSH